MSFKGSLKCLAVIGKKNEPLYIRSFTEEKVREDDLKFHYFIHSSLDVVEEKVIQAARLASQSKAFIKPYLGLLCPVENYRIHGYLTNTKLKLILVLEDNPIKESDVIDYFNRLHFVLIEYLCNPFNEAAKITSQHFDLFVDRINK